MPLACPHPATTPHRTARVPLVALAADSETGTRVSLANLARLVEANLCRVRYRSPRLSQLRRAETPNLTHIEGP